MIGSRTNKGAQALASLVIGFLVGLAIGETVRCTSAHADGSSEYNELRRSREALESIAHSLERCAK